MTDKYIINSQQQGQPQNSKSAVGSPNVVDTVGGRLSAEERTDEGPIQTAEHAEGARARVIPGAESGRSMGAKIGK